MEKDGKVLRLRRIHVSYRLEGMDPDRRDAAERAHEHHAAYCPVARSIQDAIDITTEIEYA